MLAIQHFLLRMLSQGDENHKDVQIGTIRAQGFSSNSSSVLYVLAKCSLSGSF